MTSSFSQEQTDAFHGTFNSIDSNKDGFLNVSELKRFMERCNLPTRFLKAIFKVFDSNHDSMLSFAEFIKYLEACSASEATPHFLFSLIFKAIDTDHSNGLSKTEMAEFADLCGLRMTNEDIANEMRKYDADHNGELTFDEVCLAFSI